MTHITHRVSRAIITANIDRKWCRSMNDQFDLEQGWKNEPLKDLYPTQAHLTNSTKWMYCKDVALRKDLTEGGWAEDVVSQVS